MVTCGHSLLCGDVAAVRRHCGVVTVVVEVVVEMGGRDGWW